MVVREIMETSSMPLNVDMDDKDVATTLKEMI